MTSARNVAAPVKGRPPAKAPGLLLGLGFGGLIDGIVLHQILQWHHMVSATSAYPATTLAGLQVNTLADGFFHLATWVLLLVGSIGMTVQWRNGRLAPSWSFYFGLLIAGWGVFNVVEGIVDHHLLQVHHVRDDLGAPLSWDIGFLVFGVLLVVGGAAMYRRGLRAVRSRAGA